jgi:putative ABC transport system permease protein
MKRQPPDIALKFLRWFCREDCLEEIEGDLTELYKKECEKYQHRAKWKFVWRVLKYFRPEFLKSFKNSHRLNPYGMYKSYFTIGWRNLLRNRSYSAINIGGLALGMAVAILNGLAIWHEFSYNKYFDNYPRIAKVAETGINEETQRWTSTTMTYALSIALIDNHHQHFKNFVRVSWNVNSILSTNNIMLSASGLYASEEAPEMFTFKMIQGTRAGLKEMNSILISQSLAKSLFGTVEVINRTIRMNNKTDVVVTGVFEDFPDNTEFNDTRFFAPWSLFLAENPWIEQRALTDWRNHFLQIYAEINSGLSFESVDAKIKSALQFAPEDKEKAAAEKRGIFLYPMSRWHLYPPSSYRTTQYEPIKMIRLVGAIGLFVLLLACINFMNLSTARSERRAKEVGIRKTIGSMRGQLVKQFLSESFLIVFFAFILAVGITFLSLPWFNNIATKQIMMPWTNVWFWLACGAFVVLTSLMAGSYPAFYLSSVNPIKALKGPFCMGSLSALPRKVLVVFQFSISIILIIGTAIVYQQIQYAKNRPVGYDRDGLIMIRKKSNDFNGKYDVLRTELKNTGAVFEVSESMGPVTEAISGNNGWAWKGCDPNIDESFVTLAVSHLHGKTAGWQFVRGRDFDPTVPSDSSSIIINEAALKFMGLKDPIGEPVSWTWWSDKSRVMNYKIIGVIRDLVMDSPYAPSEPSIFYLKGHNGTPNWINIKINPQLSVSEALPKIEAVFKKVIPAVPFEYQFADEQYAKKFGKEERIANLASFFAALAILISCLGLLGLSSFVAEQRTKEIGIRKVLGASVANLWRMLSKDFVLLIVMACMVASPLAYYFFLENWLMKFEYRTEISMWLFILTGLGAVIVTLLTVSFQAIKAALMNPVKSLRSE